jgi:hypothetical protein
VIALLIAGMFLTEWIRGAAAFGTAAGAPRVGPSDPSERLDNFTNCLTE